MSVLINMEMPKNCGECIFHRPLYHTSYCIILNKNCAPHTTIKDFCPLVPVPPHGRLGDLDELYASLKKWLIQNRHSMTEATRVWIRGVLEGIAAAPTIIEAEEGE